MKIRSNKIDYLMEVLCLVMLVGLTIYLGISWSSLPDKIPAHYDFAGNIDRWQEGGTFDCADYVMVSVFNDYRIGADTIHLEYRSKGDCGK